MQRRTAGEDDDNVTEAGMESFPASDPPSYATPLSDHEIQPVEAAAEPELPERKMSSGKVVGLIAVAVLAAWGAYLALR